MIKDIAVEHKALEDAKKEVERLQKVISDKLEAVKAEKGTSFRQGSNFYQIRKRGDLNYICQREGAKGSFGSWLKKDKGETKARTTKSAPEAAQAEA